MMSHLHPLLLLTASNVFMTFAWYGHLKDLKNAPLWIAILSSWGIAFFEYCLQVPANRMGSQVFSLQQLKISQEIITMIVFAFFSVFYMKVPVTRNFLYASLCLLGAAFFLFRD
jgi:uncharacterized protein (DUF486 family)